MPQRDFSRAMFKPPCAACQFPLPFRLLLRPGLIQVPIAEQPLFIFIREVKQEAYDKRTAIAKVEGMDLSRDRAGIIRFSDVEIHFPYDLLRHQPAAELIGFDVGDEPSALSTEWLDSLHSQVERVSIFAVNRLLRIYRLLSGEHYVRPITLSDIFYMQTGWLIPRLLSPFKMAIGPQNQAFTLEAHPFSDDFHHKLAQWLAEEKEVPLWVELVEDAREYLEVGRFRHVVIDSRTALEVYIDQTLLACFAQQGLSPADIAVKLRLPKSATQSIRSPEEAIKLARINEKLKYGLKQALGIQLGRRKVWADWLVVKEAREGSVHYGENVPEELARLSLDVTEALITAMHSAGSPVSASLRS